MSGRVNRWVAGAAAGLVLGSVAPSAAYASPADGPGTLAVDTVPRTPGTRVTVDGNTAVAGQDGRVLLPVARFTGLDERLRVPVTRVSPDRRVRYDRTLGDPEQAANGKPIVLGLRTERRVRWQFVDRGGRQVPMSRVSSLTLRNNMGQTLTFSGADLDRPHWLAATRTQHTERGLVVKRIAWQVRSAVVGGGEVVNSGQQVFFPVESQSWRIGLLFYRIELVGRDLLFGSLAGRGVELVGPAGDRIRQPFDDQGVALVDRLPRAQYDVRVYGDGVSFVRPLSVSVDQRYEIEVITRFDIILIAAALALVALSLLAIGRRRRLARWRVRVPRRMARLIGLGAVLAALLSWGVAFHTEPATAATAPGTPRSGAGTGRELPPVFAYYYIWYQPTSWHRAKTDYPLLGRYSSDDPLVLRRHVQMAKAAGLTGFLVSWKDDNGLTERLSKLVRIAQQEDFKLAVVYQGLDFQRHPLPVEKVAADLQTFADRYAGNSVFDEFGRPVVVITGTESYTVRQLRQATAGVKDRLTILASAKSAEDYRRTAPVVQGDAYYWSSADPRKSWHSPRLQDIGAAVRADHGLWMAPAPAGFDARQIGGEQVVPRRGGETLRRAFDSAMTSRPDAIGLISWNEYSENSHVEPSQQYGAQELRSLAGILGGHTWLPRGLHRDEVPTDTGMSGWGALLLLTFLLAALNFVLVVHRRRHGRLRQRGSSRTPRGGPEPEQAFAAPRLVDDHVQEVGPEPAGLNGRQRRL